ncbi:MAG: hypothetical protein EXQ56_01625 [Acidobacteria bacterium]|nr:hypothetical protein [Acidobacteriota bacterium]
MKNTCLRNAIMRIMILVIGILLGAAWVGQAQRNSPRLPSTNSRHDETDPNDPRKKLARRMLKESFEAMQKESRQLVEMSTELRDILRATTEDEMSLGAMKKAEAIEKLAEKIKNRIKNL